MDELFCNSCGNFQKVTTEFTYCMKCQEIRYKKSRNLFPFVSGKAIGFLTLMRIDASLIQDGLGLSSIDAVEEYFFHKSEYFPSHLFALQSLAIKQNYFDWLSEIRPSELRNSVVIEDTVAYALSEIKYLLYGSDGLKEQLNPSMTGIHVNEFKLASMTVRKVVSSLFSNGLVHFCDSCYLLGEKGRMLQNGGIHQYDGCVWCI